MSTKPHPLTGVELNVISKKRKTLTRDDAITAWVLRIAGVSLINIVHSLGTTTYRVRQVFKQVSHPGTRTVAINMVATSGHKQQQRPH